MYAVCFDVRIACTCVSLSLDGSIRCNTVAALQSPRDICVSTACLSSVKAATVQGRSLLNSGKLSLSCSTLKTTRTPFVHDTIKVLHVDVQWPCGRLQS